MRRPRCFSAILSSVAETIFNQLVWADPTTRMPRGFGVRLSGMSESNEGEILKASAPEIKVGMEVSSLDGQPVGKVKEVRGDEFLLDRSLARDLWVPHSAV